MSTVQNYNIPIMTDFNFDLDEKFDDWFCEDMPSISPGDESQSLG